MSSLPRGGGGARVPATNEFQRFVKDSTGTTLPIFGLEFFGNAPSTFAPIQNTPVPSEYVLGPGDEVLIRGWGVVDIDYRAVIDRNGLVNIPTMGSVVLGGVKASDAEKVVHGVVGRFYKDMTLSVTFGQLRAITVYVVGNASRPGTYTVSSLSTLVTALFSSGGPDANGSLRRVQLMRGGKQVAELDLYAFIGKGDKSGDVKLQDGDTIFIPPAAGYVAVTGAVNSPAIYELQSTTDTVAAVLALAGGMPVMADPRRAYLERIEPGQQQPRRIEQFALDVAGLSKPVKNGDLLTVVSITPDFSNAVTLRGNVDQALRAPYKQDMRVSDLIPSRDYLITRASVKRKNDAVLDAEAGSASLAARIGSLVDAINWNYAVVERINRTDLSVEILPFNLANALAQRGSADDVVLLPGDVVTVFSQEDVRVPQARRRVFVRVEGEVNVPGVYQMTAGETLQDLVQRAGGPTEHAYLFGVEFYRQQVRKEQKVNMERALRRMESQIQGMQAKTAARASSGTVDPAQAEARRQAEMQLANEALARLRALEPTGRVTFGFAPGEQAFSQLPSLKMQDGDQLVVPSMPDFVHIYGAVNQEASTLWQPNRSVSDYLKTAGLTTEADDRNVFVLRADGSVLASPSGSWFRGGLGDAIVMPGDSIVVPEKLDRETGWMRFTAATKDWAQIFSGFGLGAAAIQAMRGL